MVSIFDFLNIFVTKGYDKNGQAPAIAPLLYITSYMHIEGRGVIQAHVHV